LLLHCSVSSILAMEVLSKRPGDGTCFRLPD
jgi:hypothetical protein